MESHIFTLSSTESERDLILATCGGGQGGIDEVAMKLAQTKNYAGLFNHVAKRILAEVDKPSGEYNLQVALSLLFSLLRKVPNANEVESEVKAFCEALFASPAVPETRLRSASQLFLSLPAKQRGRYVVFKRMVDYFTSTSALEPNSLDLETDPSRIETSCREEWGAPEADSVRALQFSVFNAFKKKNQLDFAYDYAYAILCSVQQQQQQQEPSSVLDLPALALDTVKYLIKEPLVAKRKLSSPSPSSAATTPSLGFFQLPVIQSLRSSTPAGRSAVDALETIVASRKVPDEASLMGILGLFACFSYLGEDGEN